jgi:hypothetical protein
MCLLLTLMLLGPRAAIIVAWGFWPGRWELAFDTFIVPFIGFLFLPWTTLVYVLASAGGVEGFDWFLVALGFFFDVASLASGGIFQRRRTAMAT